MIFCLMETPLRGESIGNLCVYWLEVPLANPNSSMLMEQKYGFPLENLEIRYPKFDGE